MIFGNESVAGTISEIVVRKAEVFIADFPAISCKGVSVVRNNSGVLPNPCLSFFSSAMHNQPGISSTNDEMYQSAFYSVSLLAQNPTTFQGKPHGFADAECHLIVDGMTYRRRLLM